MSSSDMNLEFEIKNFRLCWYQGQTGFQEGQNEELIKFLNQKRQQQQ